MTILDTTHVQKSTKAGTLKHGNKPLQWHLKIVNHWIVQCKSLDQVSFSGLQFLGVMQWFTMFTGRCSRFSTWEGLKKYIKWTLTIYTCIAVMQFYIPIWLCTGRKNLEKILLHIDQLFCQRHKTLHLGALVIYSQYI